MLIDKTKRARYLSVFFALIILLATCFSVSIFEIEETYAETTSSTDDGIMTIANTEGYHTEYHEAHGYYHQTWSGTDGLCSQCRNLTVSYTQQIYDFICNGESYITYIYGEYPSCSTCGTVNLADYSIRDSKTWTLLYNSGGTIWDHTYDNFMANFLPATYSCPGYEVVDQYILTLNANGGTVYGQSSTTLTTANIIYGIGNWDTLSKATRTGYTFKGWFSAPSGGVQTHNSSGFRIANTEYWNSGGGWCKDLEHGASVTLYAQWDIIAYTVTYNANGGSTSAGSKTCYYDTSVDLSPTATKSGYTFVGWGLSPTDEKPLTSLTMPAGNVTLYALYSIQVSDVSNHTYPSYDKVNSNEVYLTVTNSSNVRKTYPLTYLSDAGIMYYAYQLNSTSLASHVGSTSYKYQMVAYDNAGNYSVILHGGQTVPEPVYYWQTVEHYQYNQAESKWEYFTTTNDNVLEGSTYTPAYVTAPTGYKTDQIDGAYTVTGTKTSKAYYTPSTYTLKYHPNGGSVSPTSKSIIYGDYYGEMPTPVLKGHSFTGWFTSATGNTEVKDTTKYTTAGNTTIYAHWTPNSYKVTYDYETNGGTSVSKGSASVVYNTAIDLSVTAIKDGWSFVGWNTNPDATTGLSSLTISDEDVHLYAIFKKNLTATFVDGLNKTTNTITKTIYNRETSCKITTRPIAEVDGWTIRGWSFNTEGDAAIHVSPDVEYELANNQTFYACYLQNIIVSYDTNGSAQVIPSQTEERFYNSSGNYKNPTFITANGPTLDSHTFVQWEELDENGSVISYYPEKETITVDHNLEFTAKWDQHPKIEAYDRYFTLEDAQNGDITADRLLEKVTATDREDGTLENGSAVIVKDYSEDVFTEITTDKEVYITYEAKDSFGNTTTKVITIHVVDTTVHQSPTVYYSRFISSEFYFHEAGYLPESEGGLASTSIWRTNPVYEQLLTHTLLQEEPILSWHFPKKGE